MADNQHKVIWCEGMFLQPHHFQQQERYWRSQIASTLQLGQYAWGFTRLRLDLTHLRQGIIALSECAGIFPDGSSFDYSADETTALPTLRVTEDMVGATVALALPLMGRHRLDSCSTPSEQELVRYRTIEAQVADRITPDGETILMQLGELNLCLAPEAQVCDSYCYLPIAQVQSLRPDGQIILDDDYIPPVLSYRAAPRLARWVDDFLGRLHLRQRQLQEFNTLSAGSGAMDVSRFLFRQSVNRAVALLTHFSVQDRLHPEVLFRELLALTGEWAIFSSERNSPLPRYDHWRLDQTFSSLMYELQHILSIAGCSNVITLPLEQREFGIYHAQITDTALIQSARLILAAKAEMPSNTLRDELPSRLKVGTSERIHDMVNLQLAGLSVTALQTLPHEVPYFDGYQYFELGTTVDGEEKLQGASSLAIHVAGHFPNGELALWAFRENDA
ncbi:type VI secretion system baseplate subunit TssK [Cedecea sp.]|jgi:type VI secretion system protein ImpJ|uniref:type VI secretion system baseplate subunit TssK n=1 Tax=Cedecea sp. TaxID=1970739 RepID=UPI002F42064C